LRNAPSISLRGPAGKPCRSGDRQSRAFQAGHIVRAEARAVLIQQRAYSIAVPTGIAELEDVGDVLGKGFQEALERSGFARNRGGSS